MKRLTTGRDVDELVARIRTLTPDSRREWGRMTCAQMVCHLADAFRARFGNRPASARRDTWLTRSVMKWVALRTPMPWPHDFRTSPEIDQVAGAGTPPGKFAEDVTQLIDLITRFMRQPGGNGTPHPLFGPLTTAEWARWGWGHVDHHLRQFGA